MSKAHFQSLQQIIEELEALGYKDVTDSVKPIYHPYLYICTLQRPISEQEKGPIYCQTIERLLAVWNQARPASLLLHVWFCEGCQAISSILCQPDSGYTEIVEALSRSHQDLSPDCNSSPLRTINPTIIASPAALTEDQTIPDWAKGPLAAILFKEDQACADQSNGS